MNIFSSRKKWITMLFGLFTAGVTLITSSGQAATLRIPLQVSILINRYDLAVEHSNVSPDEQISKKVGTLSKIKVIGKRTAEIEIDSGKDIKSYFVSFADEASAVLFKEELDSPFSAYELELKGDEWLANGPAAKLDNYTNFTDLVVRDQENQESMNMDAFLQKAKRHQYAVAIRKLIRTTFKLS